MIANIDQCILDLQSKYNIIDIIDTSQYSPSSTELYKRIKDNHKETYHDNERIVFVITQDFYKENSCHGIVLQSLQAMVNDIDISNYFVCLVTTNEQIQIEYSSVLDNVSFDTVPWNLIVCQGKYHRYPATDQRPYIKYQKILQLQKLEKLSQQQKYLLFESKNFCMMPWISLMLTPGSVVKPCCESTLVLGDCSKQSLKHIWNADTIKNMRQAMLADKMIPSCQACYRKENLGRDTLRKSINRRFLEHIELTEKTQSDGYLETFNLRYLDARFNNLCNLSCRSCLPESSSSWHEPAVYLGLKDKESKPLLIAGKNEIDILEQLKDHIFTLDRIYFAGGEPLMIEQFYTIVELLDQHGRHEVELIYNTNMTKNSLKQKSIFELWKNFKNISVGASLDAEGSRGEYLRAGSDWSTILQFRQRMMQLRPDIDFYISATISIINALHLPDFHRSWTEQGLIKAEDFNIQMLFGPAYLRLDSAPAFLKAQIREKYNRHLQWLRPRDKIGRAVYGYESILNFIDNDIQFDPELFWNSVDSLDKYHQTNLVEVFPELVDIPRGCGGIS